MRIGILSDTHDELIRTRKAVALLQDAGVEVLIHCGDFIAPAIVSACSALPLWFVFGNNDSDTVPELQKAAWLSGANCLGWSGIVELAGKRIGVAHGHMSTDVRLLLSATPDYLLTGHSHIANDSITAGVRRINPGALHRAIEFTVAVLDLQTDELQFFKVLDKIKP
jgi:uncharacterized protein